MINKIRVEIIKDVQIQYLISKADNVKLHSQPLQIFYSLYKL